MYIRNATDIGHTVQLMSIAHFVIRNDDRVQIIDKAVCISLCTNYDNITIVYKQMVIIIEKKMIEMKCWRYSHNYNQEF